MSDVVTQTMTRMNRGQRYQRQKDRVGGCIYRAEGEAGHEGRLTDEHIIAQQIGGTLILEHASCDDCSGETGAFEGHAFHPIRPLRQQLGFSMSRETRKRMKRHGEDKFIIKADGRKIKVPMSEFPALAIHLAYPLPGILINDPMDDRTLAGSIHGIELTPGFGERLNKLKAKYHAREIAIVGVEAQAQRQNQTDYGRMLAKVAHSYTVAELGLGNFRPFLLGIIQNRQPLNLAYFIGSAIGTPELPTDMHEIAFVTPGALGDRRLIIVKLRLFANLKSQTHYVIVGETL